MEFEVLTPGEREPLYRQQLKEGLVSPEFAIPDFELDTIVLNAATAQLKKDLGEFVKWGEQWCNHDIHPYTKQKCECRQCFIDEVKGLRQPLQEKV